MSWVEVLGFVSGAVCVWLATRQNVWNFPVGIANNLLFLWLFTDAGLYANAGLQVVFAALAVLGWVWWVRGGPDRRALAVTRTPRWVWPAGAAVLAAATVGLTALLSTTAGSAAPFWDALTTSSSLVAQVMLGRKWLESWAVWIGTDIVLVGLYASQGLHLTAVLYAGFIGLCVLGWRDWRRALATASEPAPVAVPA
ncbi:nicotinamide riboside transporter PnuC [Cellulomonas terrae]|uniref:Transporter n=1 Tax=Cellulomonas terrae TaxID=311234 RepID=A0A511JM44_9CELL|nr:nicotinamide riboside transporter PnuC [Cellulomonas terrae]GEL99092.1 transporter [Cellulomonas terrae]